MMREVILGLCVAAAPNHVVHVARVEELGAVGGVLMRALGSGVSSGRPSFFEVGDCVLTI